jgi:acetolactate synthase-1/3 small subunit
VVNTNQELIEKVVKQIEKVVDVLRAYYLCEEEIIHQEIALYKVPTEALTRSNEIEGLVRKYNARILEVTTEYTVIEKTGHKEETQQLFDDMKDFGVLQFTRSGRIAITKATRERLSEYLVKLDTEKPPVRI